MPGSDKEGILGEYDARFCVVFLQFPFIHCSEINGNKLLKGLHRRSYISSLPEVWNISHFMYSLSSQQGSLF